MRDGRPVTVEVTADGARLVSHAGSALFGAGGREAVLANGDECVSDLGAVRDQRALFGPVASDSTAFRMVDRIASDPVLVDALRSAHARARERFLEPARRPGAGDDRRRRDADHGAFGEGEGAAGNYKGGYGYRPLQAYADETREALGGLVPLRLA